MNEVEKMYENVGVEKRLLCDRDRDVLCEHIRPDGKSRQAFGCFGCEYKNDAYPPFTAEKQLNIIKWLLKNYDIDFSQLGQRIDTSLDGVNCISGLGSGDIFEESLAQAINNLWQDLTEKERKQIKEILE